MFRDNNNPNPKSKCYCALLFNPHPTSVTKKYLSKNIKIAILGLRALFFVLYLHLNRIIYCELLFLKENKKMSKLIIQNTICNNPFVILDDKDLI